MQHPKVADQDAKAGTKGAGEAQWCNQGILFKRAPAGIFRTGEAWQSST